jgi:hypothetical protein
MPRSRGCPLTIPPIPSVGHEYRFRDRAVNDRSCSSTALKMFEPRRKAPE